MGQALGLEARRWASYFPVATGFFLLLCTVAGLSAGRSPSFWLTLLLVVPLIVVRILRPRAPWEPRGGAGEAARRSERAGASRRSSVETFLIRIIGLGSALALPFALGLSLWKAVQWLTAHAAGGTILGFDPARVSSVAAGGIAALLFLVGLAVYAVWPRRGTPT